MSKKILVWMAGLAFGILSAIPQALADSDIEAVTHGTNRPPAQTFYLPLPENDFLTVLQSIANGSGGEAAPVDPMQAYISITVFVDKTVVYYDQWENGFEQDIANPNNVWSETNPGGTQIWGDGDPSNGIAPGFTTDILKSGDVILLENAVSTKTRGTVITFDGGDKFGTTKPVAVTRAGWASGSATLLAGANEVYDTAFFGTEFQSPVGTDTPDMYELFEYTGFSIMASRDDTTVKVDADNDGVFETTTTLKEGGNYLVNGGVKQGGRIVADKPVQVELLTGDIYDGFESRFYRLLPTSMWSASLTTPVATAPYRYITENGQKTPYYSGTKVFLYNPSSADLTVYQITRNGKGASSLLTTNTVTVAAKGSKSVVLTEGYGDHFVSPAGKPFYAISATDATGTSSSWGVNHYGANRTWDWGFSLVPDDALTAQVFVGLGLGRDPTSSVNPTEDGAPIWVTPVGNGNKLTRIYVDYDGDPTTGSAEGVDASGNKYDVCYDLYELQSQKVYNPSGDQTGMLIYTLDKGVKLAAAWGADPTTTTPGQPGLDLGTGIPPIPEFFMQKTSKLLTDNDGDGYITPGDVVQYDIAIENIGRQPVTDLFVGDVLPTALSYIANTTVFTDENGTKSSIADNAEGNIFPLSVAGGYALDGALPVRSTWHVTYSTLVKDFGSQSGVEALRNAAFVCNSSASYTNSILDYLRGRVGDYVWVDANTNGIQDAGEVGMNGVTVRLLKADGTQAVDDFDKPYEFVTRNDSNGNAGYYIFTGVRAGNYLVSFEAPTNYAFTVANAGENAAADSDAEANGFTGVFRMDGGQFKLDVDAGLYDTYVPPTPEPEPIPERNPTLCELLDFGQTFNAIIFGDFYVRDGDTENSLLVWGDANIGNSGYSVGYATEDGGEKVPTATADRDALIVAGNFKDGNWGVNGNVVYGGIRTGEARTGSNYSVRHVSPVTIDREGNVPDDASGMTKAQMLARVKALSSALAAFDEQGVASKTKAWGTLTLTGTNEERNVFDVTADQWKVSSGAIVFKVPADSTVIVNVTGENISLKEGSMNLPKGMTANQVIVNYVNATNIVLNSIDHQGAMIAPYAKVTFNAAAVNGLAAIGGNVKMTNGAEFHNYALQVFHCPVYPAIRLTVTANTAANGSILNVVTGANVTAMMVVSNAGPSYLSNVVLTMPDGTQTTLKTLAPDESTFVQTQISGITEDTVIIASVTAQPSDFDGNALTEYAAVSDTETATVKLYDAATVAAMEAAAKASKYGENASEASNSTQGNTATETWDTPESYSSEWSYTPRPDFEVTKMEFIYKPSLTGETFSVTVYVKNSGEVAGNAGKLGIYFNDNYWLTTNDVAAAVQDAGIFAKGEVKTFTFEGLIANADAGTHAVMAFIDCTRQAKELSEDDNFGNLTYDLNAIRNTITVNADGVTLTWNNYWGQIYTIVGSSDLKTWTPVPGYENILAARPAKTNSVTIPFSADAPKYFRLKVVQE